MKILNAAGSMRCVKRKVCWLPISKEIEYYEDEELDRFRGREADEYSNDEIEEFRYVLETMREDEVAGWCRSLQLRAIILPEALKDEVLMIVGELRQ